MPSLYAPVKRMDLLEHDEFYILTDDDNILAVWFDGHVQAYELTRGWRIAHFVLVGTASADRFRCF